MTDQLPEKPPDSQILFYQTEDGRSRIEVRLEGGTVWLDQSGFAKLYQTTRQNITTHIQNIYDEHELGEEATCKEYLQVQIEGDRQIKRRNLHQNLHHKSTPPRSKTPQNPPIADR